MAVVGTGLPYALDRPALPSDHADPLRADTAGDVARHHSDRQGNVTPWEGEGRVIAVSSNPLRAVPLVIGLAVEAVKVPSIIGAARARLVTHLITDTRTAMGVLAALAMGA